VDVSKSAVAAMRFTVEDEYIITCKWLWVKVRNKALAQGVSWQRMISWWTKDTFVKISTRSLTLSIFTVVTCVSCVWSTTAQRHRAGVWQTGKWTDRQTDRIAVANTALCNSVPPKTNNCRAWEDRNCSQSKQ